MNLIIIACLIVFVSADNATNQTAKHDNQSGNSTQELLKASETADRTKVEIVKQIKRINDDGSYTVGYEADDGTFKIESRDVRGNVKGTFGYIDKDGDIKRVTYSSSSDSTPVPVSTITTPITPVDSVNKVNKTVSSTTRRTNPTIVYPTRSSFTTRGTVVQPIPRRRLANTHRSSNVYDTTTETKLESTTSNILHLYKSKTEENLPKRKTSASRDDLQTKSTTVLDSTTKPSTTVKPVYENINEKATEVKSNAIRRQLADTSPNPHMIKLQQSIGDDSTDVYGGHLSMGTVRPLFTTTTPRQRLIPLHSLVAARHKIQQQYQNIDDQETTIEASTGRVFDHENVVTSNPVPVIHIPQHRERVDDRVYQQQQPIYRKPHANVVFRTQEYLRDNPGAPIPIGNTRQILYQNQFEPQFVKDAAQAKGTVPEAATISPHDPRTVTRIIPIAVDERGIPLNAYQARFINPYRPQTQQPPPPVLVQPRLIEPVEDMNSITTPVSTRDLKRLLQILIIRQNRLQALMDQLIGPGPPYQPLPLIRQQQYEYRPPSRYQPAPRYQEEDRYDYRYEQDRQNDLMYQYDNYESQRFVPRRKLYTRPVYDADGASSNRVEEAPEYLPADIREALLLKMLMLAISPDFLPTPPPVTEMTTSTPTRKQVRNVQILGEESSMEMKHMRH